MKRARRLTALLLTLMMVTTFASAQREAGDKDLVSRARDVAPFTALDVSGTAEVMLIQGEPQSVVVKASEAAQEKIILKVENETLFITDKGATKFGKILFMVTTPSVNKIVISGASNLKGDGLLRMPALELKTSGASEMTLSLDVENLVSEVSGAATMKLAGRAGQHQTSVSGAGDLKAMELETGKATVKVSGAGNARLDVVDDLVSDVSGAGDITLKRDPVTQSSSGKSGSATVVTAPGIKVITTKHGDSTVVKIGEYDIQVVEGDSIRVNVGGTGITLDEDGKVKLKKNKKQRFNGHWGGFELGINGLLNNENGMDLLGPDKLNPGYAFLGDLNLAKSINVKLNFYEQNFNLARNKLGLVTGVGLEYANYRFDNNIRLFPDSATVFGLPMKEDGVSYSKSKLVVNYLTVPLILEYQTNRHSKTNSFHISAGILAGLRIGSHTKMVFDAQGKEKSKTRDDFHINPLKYEAMVRLGWGVINLNAHYSLNTLFRDGRGPEMYPFSIGLALTSW